MEKWVETDVRYREALDTAQNGQNKMGIMKVLTVGKLLLSKTMGIQTDDVPEQNDRAIIWFYTVSEELAYVVIKKQCMTVRFCLFSHVVPD